MSISVIDTDNPKYKRDMNSKALLATGDVRAQYEEYLAKTRMIETAKNQELVQATQQEQINNLTARVDAVDAKLDYIINLLTDKS